MRKINLNIEVSEERIFDEILFKKENPELYEKYLSPLTKETNIKIVKNWVGNWISRAINCPKREEKTNIERATKSADIETQRKYARIMNALDKEKDGWVKLEDADFDNLIKWWESPDAGLPVQKDTAILLNNIDEAFQEAKTKKGNPD